MGDVESELSVEKAKIISLSLERGIELSAEEIESDCPLKKIKSSAR